MWGLRGGEEKMDESTLVKMKNPDPTRKKIDGGVIKVLLV